MGEADRATRRGLRALSGPAVSLTRLRAGQGGKIAHVAPGAPDLMVKLSSLGILPGATIRLQQKLPAAVVRIGETAIALDPEIAAEIFVEAD